MKSEKQRILEAYSEDLKAMYIESEAETKQSDVKKWIVDTPTHVTEKHNIVNAYASIVEADEFRLNKMHHLNQEILKEGSMKKYQEMADKYKKDMDHYEECGDMDSYENSKKKYEEAMEGLKESEGLKPAPAPEKHDATGTTDGGDTTSGKVSDEEMKDQYDNTVKEGDDSDEDEDEDEMNEMDTDGVEDPDEVVHGTGSKDGGVVTKSNISYKQMKENKEAYMAYAKKIIGDRDLTKMSDDEKKELFNKIDSGWNSEDEPGKDGKK
jgi:hypothetical protein